MHVQGHPTNRHDRPQRAKKLRREDVVDAPVWAGTHELVVDIAVVLRQGRVHLNKKRRKIARDLGLRKYNQVILGSSIDPNLRGRLRVLGVGVDVYRIRTPYPMAVKSSDWRSEVSVDIEPIPELGGASVEFNRGEYLEVYDDEAGLSSAQWSTFSSVDEFVARSIDALGVPAEGKKAAVRLDGPKRELREFAADDKSLLKYVRNNALKIAFCRVDFGIYSILWNANPAPGRENDDKADSGRGDATGGIVFRTGDIGPVIVTIETTGTENVRNYVAKALPDLVKVIANYTL